MTGPGAAYILCHSDIYPYSEGHREQTPPSSLQLRTSSSWVADSAGLAFMKVADIISDERFLLLEVELEEKVKVG